VQAGRGSVLLVELLAPEATGVDVLALSAGWRLEQRTTLAAGFQHLGVDGIERTEDSPESGTRIDVSQDLFAVGAARQLTPRLLAGAGAQYLRSSEALNEDGQLSIGAGVRLQLPLPLAAALAGYAASVEDRVLWGAAAEVTPPVSLGSWQTMVNLGVSGGQAVRGTTWRAGLATTWRGMLELGGAVVVEPDAQQRQWEPVVAAAVRLSRYELGVVREWLPNSFGAVHTFRFGVTF
jgi:hypothetical protein